MRSFLPRPNNAQRSDESNVVPVKRKAYSQSSWPHLSSSAPYRTWRNQLKVVRTHPTRCRLPLRPPRALPVAQRMRRTEPLEPGMRRGRSRPRQKSSAA